MKKKLKYAAVALLLLGIGYSAAHFPMIEDGMHAMKDMAVSYAQVLLDMMR